MFDLGLGIGEIIIIAIIALLVIPPKDLPRFFYKVGQFIGRMRSMASEFKYTMEDIAHEQEIDYHKRHIEASQQPDMLKKPTNHHEHKNHESEK